MKQTFYINWLNFLQIKKILRTIGDTVSDDQVDEIIREMDMDGDGEVDYNGKPGQGKLSTMYAGPRGGGVLGQDKVSTLYAGAGG